MTYCFVLGIAVGYYGLLYSRTSPPELGIEYRDQIAALDRSALT